MSDDSELVAPGTWFGRKIALGWPEKRFVFTWLRWACAFPLFHLGSGSNGPPLV